MFERCGQLIAENDELERQLADPALHADPAMARRVGKRHAQLRPVIEAYREWLRLDGDVGAARELVVEDPDFAAEVAALEAAREATAERLTALLVPADPLDGSDVIMEIRAGEGGAESALFAADLMRMYLRFAERHGFVTEMLDIEESDLGGIKDASLAVKARGIPEPGGAPFDLLRFEGGVHRVQRVPVTESQGRIHTSAAGVLVLPETEDVEIEINPGDLRIDVFRSSGPGGQSVNTTDSAVRITHLPTGLVVSCQNEKSQLQNREQAMRILRARLVAQEDERRAVEASATRRAQVRTVDRSERIRTYNFPENRISDHRTGFKAHNLDQVLEGELEAVVRSCIEADLAARLADVGD